MKSKYDPESCIHSILATAEGSEGLGELVQRIRRERYYKDTRIQAVLRQHADPVFQRLAAEAGFLCAVEAELLREIRTISDNFKSPGSELIHTLLALESLQRIRLGIPGCPAIPLQIDVRDLDGEQYQSKYDAFAGWDYFIEYFGVVLGNLVSKVLNVEPGMKISPRHVGIAATHLSQATKWQIFHEFRAFWEHGQLQIDTEQMVLDASKSDLVRAFRISLSRVRAFRMARANDLLNVGLVQPRTTELPPKACRSINELISCYLTDLQFFSENLQEVVHGASLSEWIRAYHVLREFAIAKLGTADLRQPLDILVIKTPDFFHKLLVREGGIEITRAECIIAHLTFKKKSRDLLDCPLVPFGKYLLMVPALTAISEPAHALESLLHSIRSEKSHELSFIGPGLEASVRASLRDAGINARNVKMHNYDCDIAFVLDDVLFLCECKAKFIAADFATYSELENFLCKRAVGQHTRTGDFFSNDLSMIKRVLDLAPDWQPRSIERIIITSSKLGRAMQVDGCRITDHHAVHAYCTRKGATIKVGRKMEIRVPDDRLEGTPSAEGFLNYLGTPQGLAIHGDLLAERRMPLTIGDRSLMFVDCETYGEIQSGDD